MSPGGSIHWTLSKSQLIVENEALRKQLAAANATIIEREKELKVYNDENQALVDVINEELKVKEPHSPKQLVRLVGEKLRRVRELWASYRERTRVVGKRSFTYPIVTEMDGLLREGDH
jgi:CRISPR/Cas system CMR subunit Cmr4 (Cas7 group RAMP superfamily)